MSPLCIRDECISWHESSPTEIIAGPEYKVHRGNHAVLARYGSSIKVLVISYKGLKNIPLIVALIH